jgi:cell wall-associated NlpC family hydrolase
MNDEIRDRMLVVAEAHRWVNTPYHNCADVLGAGVDCGMLIVRVFVDTGMVPPFDPRPYSPDWMLHRDEEKYLSFFTDRCRPVDVPDLGDIVLFRYGRSYSHGGIVVCSDPVTIVHASCDAGQVVEEILHHNPLLTEARRRIRFFSIWHRD